MTELFLKYKDEYGKVRKISVNQDKFTVGRGSENNLTISDNALSRKHISIERFADVFVVTDCDSSNGTTLNGDILADPIGLKHGDKLNLGNSLKVEVEIISDSADEVDFKSTPEANSVNMSAAAGSSAAPNGSFSPMIFIIAPLAFLFVVIASIVGFLAFRPAPQVAANRDIFVRSDNSSKTPLDDDDDDPTPKPTAEPIKTTANNSATPSSTVSPTDSPSTTDITPTPKPSGDLDKVERNAYSFMRKIAENDTNPVLTGPQLQILAAKINQVKSFGSIRDNLKSARTGKSNIENLARERSMKPQLLAVAALAKLGSERGDAANTATAMRDVLNELRESVGNGLADDCFLMMAAYSEGASGEKLKMRDRLAQLTKGSQLSVRQIRTIWFLKDNGKISDAQFELAIRFLAIGTISQNPKEFGISEEPLNF